MSSLGASFTCFQKPYLTQECPTSYESKRACTIVADAFWQAGKLSSSLMQHFWNNEFTPKISCESLRVKCVSLAIEGSHQTFLHYRQFSISALLINASTWLSFPKTMGWFDSKTIPAEPPILRILWCSGTKWYCKKLSMIEDTNNYFSIRTSLA